MIKGIHLATATIALSLTFSGAASAQTTAKKPNIVMIMGDDVGMWNISAYHRGMMGGTTPNIDRIAKEGALFTDYYAQQSCTAGRAAFILGQTPAAVAFVVIATYIVLFLLLGSVVLPLKAVLMNFLSISASFGALVWIFQDGHLSAALNFTPSSIDPLKSTLNRP